MKIDFEINGFRDALILDDDHGMTDVELEDMKQARYDKWLAFVTTASAETAVATPTEE